MLIIGIVIGILMLCCCALLLHAFLFPAFYRRFFQRDAKGELEGEDLDVVDLKREERLGLLAD